MTVAATIATAPLVAFHFGTVPLAGLAANLIALPAVAPAMWLGMLKAALGLVGAALPLADALAEALGPLTRPPLAYLERTAERCADLPGGQLALPLRSPVAVAGRVRGDGSGPVVAGPLGWRRGRAWKGVLSGARRGPRGGGARGCVAAGASVTAARRRPLPRPPCSCSSPRLGSAHPRRRASSRCGSSTWARATPRLSSIRTAPPCSSTADLRRAASRGCCGAPVCGASPWSWPRTPRVITTAGWRTCWLASRRPARSTAATATAIPASTRLRAEASARAFDGGRDSRR